MTHDEHIAEQVTHVRETDGWKAIEAKARQRADAITREVTGGKLDPQDYALKCGEIEGIRYVLDTIPGLLLNAGGKPRT